MSIAIFLNPGHQYLHPEGLGLVEVTSQDDIAGYLGAGRVESLSTTSRFGHLDFWFHPVGLTSQDVNRPATELLLAATRLTARTVPLLRGRVVLTSHDENGELAGLTRQQISQVASHPSRGLDQWLLDWRYRVDRRALRRRVKTSRAGADRAGWEGFRNALPPPRPTSDQ
ncbi:hypothetical protein SKC41_28830 [Mycobacterium sp. 050128]|uniref:hypothetical protein n=1 Tax=unclassified Mycobacterium TaxID=2642494 RepID=UPI002EDA0123